jgi:acetyl esterase
MVDKIGGGGFGKTPGVFEFMPTYIPEGMSVEQLRTELLKSIKAAAPSYGVFASSSLNHYSEDPAADESWKKAVAPQSNIPEASERAVPQFLVLGTQDELISDKMVSDFKAALEAKGQRAEYVKVDGAHHAFFDWKPDLQTKGAFFDYGVP